MPVVELPERVAVTKSAALQALISSVEASLAATEGLRKRGPGRPVILVRWGQDVENLTIRALAEGGRMLPPDLEHPTDFGPRCFWNVAGKCDAPVTVIHTGRPHRPLNTAVRKAHFAARDLVMLVGCRKCISCLWARRALWGARAVTEWNNAPRTWLGTLTVRPEERYILELQARKRLALGGVELDQLTGVEKFRELHREAGPLATRYLKRLRVGNRERGFAPADARFMLAVEPHEKDFWPHYHLLIHEVSALRPIRHAVLVGQWPHGFVRFNLVKTARGATYAAKYLGKLSVARVRASKFYGDPPQEVVNTLQSQVAQRPIHNEYVSMDPLMTELLLPTGAPGEGWPESKGNIGTDHERLSSSIPG